MWSPFVPDMVKSIFKHKPACDIEKVIYKKIANTKSRAKKKGQTVKPACFKTKKKIDGSKLSRRSRLSSSDDFSSDQKPSKLKDVSQEGIIYLSED
jgi:hypothetical protein